MGASVYSLRTSAVAATTTTWGAFATDGSWDLVIPATAGTVIEVGTSVLWDNAASAYTYMDVGTIVSGSVVNWLSTGTGSHTDGVLSMFQENTAAYLSAGGSVFYTVQSGDVVSGNVTLRLYSKTNTSSRTLALSAPAHFWASVCDNGATTASLTGTLSSSSFTALSASITVTASAGDTLACSLCGLVDNSSTGLVTFDAATMVSGSPVNWFSTGGSSHAGGVGAWRCNLGNYEPMTGTSLYTVQSGDVVSGQVTVKIYGLNTSGSRVLVTGTTYTVRKV